MAGDSAFEDHSAEAFLAHGEKLFEHTIHFLLLGGATGLPHRFGPREDSTLLRRLGDELVGIAALDISAQEVLRVVDYFFVFENCFLPLRVVEDFVRAVEIDAKVRVDRRPESRLHNARRFERGGEGRDVLGHLADRLGDILGELGEGLCLAHFECLAVLRHVGRFEFVRFLLDGFALFGLGFLGFGTEGLDLVALWPRERVVEVAQRRVHQVH